MEDIVSFYTVLMGYAPMMLAAIVGIALALVLWPNARTAAVLMLVACVLQLLITSFNAGLYGWYFPHASQNGGLASMRVLLGIWGMVSSLIHAAAFVLLVCAAFAGRRRLPAANP